MLIIQSLSAPFLVISCSLFSTGHSLCTEHLHRTSRIPLILKPFSIPCNLRLQAQIFSITHLAYESRIPANKNANQRPISLDIDFIQDSRSAMPNCIHTLPSSSDNNCSHIFIAFCILHSIHPSTSHHFSLLGTRHIYQCACISCHGDLHQSLDSIPGNHFISRNDWCALTAH
jgi:hypothetical protein